MKKFIDELKRRSVIKSATAYLVVAWVLIQVSEFLLPMVNAPEWALKILTLILAIGLPIWIIISWIYDITPEGIEKTPEVSENKSVAEITNKRLNAFIIVSLSIAVIVMGLKLFNPSSDHDQRYVIAVLPFDNVNVDDNNDWFSKGLAIDIHTYLSKIENITIISERAVKEALDSKRTLAEIAKLLNVTHFIGGSVSQFENDIKINVHLTKTSNDKNQWAENYNRNLTNPFKVQQDVSQKIVTQLKVELTPEELKTLQKFPTENMEAYELFVKGRLLNKTRNKEDLESSIELFEQAIFFDPNFAEAYVAMAQSNFNLRFNQSTSEGVKELIEKAKEFLIKALNIDPNTASAYAVMGNIYDFEEDWDKSKENYEVALALNPNDAYTHSLYAKYFNTNPIPDKKKALYHHRIAQRLDPLNANTAKNLIESLIDNDKLNEAEETLNKLGYLIPEGYKTWLEISLEVHKNKDWTAEISYWERKIEKDPNDLAFCYYWLAGAYDEILNDDANSIKYAKKAYELDSTRSRFIFKYYDALLEGKKFNEAKILSQSENVRSIVNEVDKLYSLWYYYYHQDNYIKAEEILNDSLLVKNKNVSSELLLTYAQLGDRKKVDSLKNYYGLNGRMNWVSSDMAFAYAILKEKDSMYHYLEKLRPIDEFHGANSRKEFDPYRKEERFKALLRKHYLPITHWNE